MRLHSVQKKKNGQEICLFYLHLVFTWQPMLTRRVGLPAKLYKDRFSIKHVTNHGRMSSNTLYKDVDGDKAVGVKIYFNTYLGFITPPNGS